MTINRVNHSTDAKTAISSLIAKFQTARDYVIFFQLLSPVLLTIFAVFVKLVMKEPWTWFSVFIPVFVSLPAGIAMIVFLDFIVYVLNQYE